jgi:hypothetical protein
MQKDNFIDLLPIIKDDSKTLNRAERGIVSFKHKNNISYIFKPCSNASSSIYSEIIATTLALQFGLDSSQYQFAKINETKGVMCTNYLNKNDIEIPASSFMEDNNSLSGLENFINNKLKSNEINPSNAKKLLTHFIKLSMFDILVYNKDRHLKNWGLIKSGSYLKALPAFDFGMAFSLDDDYSETVHKLFEFKDGLKNNIENKNFKKSSLKDFDAYSYTLFNYKKFDKEKVEPYSYITNLNLIKDNYPLIFKEQMKKVNELDIDKVFTTIKTNTGVEVPNKIKEFVTIVFNERVNTIKKSFKLEKKSNFETLR